MKIKIPCFLFLPVLLLITPHYGHAQSLKKTVQHFAKLMADSKATELQFITQLKPFIDPAANVDSLCADYYQHWKSNADIRSFPLNTKIEKTVAVTVDSAEVYISNIWQIGEEGKYNFLSKTFWVRKNNQWYRTSAGAVRLEKRKLQN